MFYKLSLTYFAADWQASVCVLPLRFDCISAGAPSVEEGKGVSDLHCFCGGVLGQLLAAVVLLS